MLPIDGSGRRAAASRRRPRCALQGVFLAGAGVLAVAGVALLALAGGCGQRPGPAISPTAAPAPGPRLFEEITAEAGLHFIHDSGSRGEFFMPEHIGSGAALLDFDNDGRLDLYLVQCGGPQSSSRNQLFHQQPDGRFRNVSEGSGLDVVGFGMGAIAGDVNNDGAGDLFVTEYGAIRLFLNRGGGRFEDVTRTAGLDNTRWAAPASFLDYDRDGWLDIVVGNYVDYNPTQQCFDPAGLPDFCGPQNFPGTTSRLFRNLGASSPDGVRFEDVTIASGLARTTGKALGVYCADFDGDGWVDLFMADDGVPNRLLMNQRDGTFVDEAVVRGIAFNAMGATAGNMGVGVGDVNGDGWFDLFVTHLTHEQHALWVQKPRGLFQDQTVLHGLIGTTMRGTGFGTVLADFDADGWPDLAIVNGTIRRGGQHSGVRLSGLIPFWDPYAQRYQLYLNDGNARFREISASNPDFCSRAAIGRGLAVGDLDNDGDLDLVAVCAGGPVQLFRNVAPRRGHWLQVRALDPGRGGRDAIGAEITLTAGAFRRTAFVQPAYSYLVSNDPRVHFGLGAVPTVDSVRVVWPDGAEELFVGGAVDRELILRKGTGGKP